MYEEHRPESPHIDFVWRAIVTESGTFTDLAHDFWVLVFRMGPMHNDVVLAGPVTRPETIGYEAGQVNWGIAFKAHVFIPALAKSTMMNERTDLPVTSDTSFRLGRHELRIPEYEQAEEFVDGLVERGVLLSNEVIAEALAGEPPPISKRSLQRHYSSAAGLTAGQVRQIQRARHAFALLQSGSSIARAAMDAGYADQAHMTRSLKLLAGQTPGQILRDYAAFRSVALVQYR